MVVAVFFVGNIVINDVMTLVVGEGKVNTVVGIVSLHIRDLYRIKYVRES